MSLPTGNTAMDVFYARAILGIQENAAKNEIGKKYRSLAQRCHPDKLLGLSDLEKAPYIELFTMYYIAYEVLSKTNDDNSDNNDRQATLPPIALPEQVKQQQQQQQQQYAQHFQNGQWTVNGRNLQELFASTRQWEFYNDKIQRKRQREEDNVQV
jgi:DnaJ-class molecular chaperone